MIIASDVSTAINVNSGTDTDINSYTSLVLSFGGDPPIT